jgi:DNA repair protein RadA/Sms
MVRGKTQWVCQECGFRASAYLGRCTDCMRWGSLVEERIEQENSNTRRSSLARAAADAQSSKGTVLLKDVKAAESERLLTGIAGLDEVLGGGLVPGSVCLLAGDPGIGKSTLLLQVARSVSAHLKVLYVSGEESAAQVQLRAHRLGLQSELLFVTAEQNIESIVGSINSTLPQVLILDSIQAVHSPESDSAPGSVSQVRESAQTIINTAKALDIATIIVGHVNKEGLIAGPRVLEHMVDIVLQFEGDRTRQLRILRPAKNRFGATSEIAIFSMTEAGLFEVENPSAFFLGDRLHQPQRQAPSGTAVIAGGEGRHILLLEVQALVSNANTPTPRRVANGWDYNRLLQILAVLEKKVGLYFGHSDVYVNVVGGMDFEDPSGDLGVCTAIATSLLDRSIDPRLLIIGEVGLTGEIRPVTQLEQKLKEASRLGFQRAIVPQSNLPLPSISERIQITGVQLLSEALGLIMPGAKLRTESKKEEPIEIVG